MARPTVPHCKDCPHIYELQHSFPWAYGYFRCQRSSWKCLKVDQWVNGQEVRTSPKWCPRRQDALIAKPGTNA